MTMAAGKVAVIVVFVLSVFGGIWYSVVTALSKIGGWSSMANHFPAAGSVAANWPPPGDEYRFLSMTGSWGVSYKSCVTIVVSEEGLFLRPLYPFFQFSHPPLHVPWVAMASVSEMQMGVLGWVTGPRLSIKFKRKEFDPTGFSIFPGKDAVEKIRRHICVSGSGRPPCAVAGGGDATTSDEKLRSREEL